jgi:hypothetical protein
VREEIVEKNLTDNVKDNCQQICQNINAPAEGDFVDVHSDVATIQEATVDVIVNTITEEKESNSGNKEDEEVHVNEEIHESCNFSEAIHTVRTLQRFLETIKDVPDHILQYNAAIHVFLEKSFLNKLFRRK